MDYTTVLEVRARHGRLIGMLHKRFPRLEDLDQVVDAAICAAVAAGVDDGGTARLIQVEVRRAVRADARWVATRDAVCGRPSPLAAAVGWRAEVCQRIGSLAATATLPGDVFDRVDERVAAGQVLRLAPPPPPVARLRAVGVIAGGGHGRRQWQRWRADAAAAITSEVVCDAA